MILDEQGLFSNKQKITKNCTSENILALGKREVSFGTPVEIFVQIAEAFNNLTSLTIKVQTSMSEDFATSTDLVEQTITLENLTKGAVSTIKFLPKGNLGFMRLSYAVNGTAPTTGAVLACIVDGAEESFHNV